MSQFDCGSEFKAFFLILSQSCIEHWLSYPKTSQQNGVVKYKNRHVVEAKLAFLAQASIYFKYWLYAFLAIIFLKNKMFSSMLNFEPSY